MSMGYIVSAALSGAYTKLCISTLWLAAIFTHKKPPAEMFTHREPHVLHILRIVCDPE